MKDSCFYFIAEYDTKKCGDEKVRIIHLPESKQICNSKVIQSRRTCRILFSYLGNIYQFWQSHITVRILSTTHKNEHCARKIYYQIMPVPFSLCFYVIFGTSVIFRLISYFCLLFLDFLYTFSIGYNLYCHLFFHFFLNGCGAEY